MRRIADYRWRFFLYASICASIVTFGLAKNGFSSHSWQFWAGQFFLIAAIFWLLILIFSVKNKFVGRSGYEFNLELNRELDEANLDKSYFTFTSEGFVFSPPKKKGMETLWSDIREIHVWVEDQIVVDDMVCLRIDMKDNHFVEFDEVTPGFDQFVLHCNKILCCFPSNWMEKLNHNPHRELRLFKN